MVTQESGKMSIIGIGLLLAIVGAITALVLIVFTKVLGVSIALPIAWRKLAVATGVVLTAIGFFFWLASAVLVKRAYGSHQLVTTGVYGVSRNPMYAAFIVFLIPGLALLLNELMLLFIPITMFIAFKMAVGREEKYLAREFGAEFERYRNSVSQLVPFIRL